MRPGSDVMSGRLLLSRPPLSCRGACWGATWGQRLPACPLEPFEPHGLGCRGAMRACPFAGTFLNGEKVESSRFYELLEKDVIKFGYSSREYVLLHSDSQE